MYIIGMILALIAMIIILNDKKEQQDIENMSKGEKGMLSAIIVVGALLSWGTVLFVIVYKYLDSIPSNNE